MSKHTTAAKVATSDDKAKQAHDTQDKAAIETVEAKPEARKEDAEAEAPKHRSKPMVAADDNMHVYFEQGRVAGGGGISEEDAPHDPSTPEYKAWLKGWNFAHG